MLILATLQYAAIVFSKPSVYEICTCKVSSNFWLETPQEYFHVKCFARAIVSLFLILYLFNNLQWCFSFLWLLFNGRVVESRSFFFTFSQNFLQTLRNGLQFKADQFFSDTIFVHICKSGPPKVSTMR